MIIQWNQGAYQHVNEYIDFNPLTNFEYIGGSGLLSNYFRPTRDCELSLIKHLRDDFNLNWAGVTVVKSFKQALKEEVPVVCVRVIDTPIIPKEIGSTAIFRDFNIEISIFARSDGQRLDLSDFIINSIRSGWVFYEHYQDPNDRGTLLLTANGRVSRPTFRLNGKVNFGESVTKHDRFRHEINLIVGRRN